MKARELRKMLASVSDDAIVVVALTEVKAFREVGASLATALTQPTPDGPFLWETSAGQAGHCDDEVEVVVIQ